MEVKRFADASDELRAVLRDEPDDAEALCLLASCHDAAGDPRGMLAAADRALLLRPHDEWALRLRAHALLKLKRRRAATAAARAAVTSAPYVWHTHATLAEVLAARHGTRSILAARRAADTVLQMAPQQADAHVVDSVVHLRMGQVRAAREACQRALTIDPQNQAARHNLAVTDVARYRIGAAAQGFTDALALAPDDALTGAQHGQISRAVLWRLFDVLAVAAVAHFVLFSVVADAVGAARRTIAVVAAVAVLAGFGLLCLRTWTAQPPAVRWRLRSQRRAALVLPVFLLVVAAGLLINAYGPPHDSALDALGTLSLEITIVTLALRARNILIGRLAIDLRRSWFRLASAAGRLWQRTKRRG